MRRLARYAAAKVGGGVLIEEQRGVRVTPEHRGRYALRGIILHGRRHGTRLVRARGEEQNVPGLEDGRHADRDRPLRSAVRLEVAGVDLAGALGELYDAGARVEWRSRLIETYVTVAPDPEHAHVDPTGLHYGHLVDLTLSLGIGCSTLRDEDPRRVGVDEPVEVLLHVQVVARLVIRPQPQILVEVEEGRLCK